MRRVYNWMGGRCTTFALIFTAAGIVLAFKDELTALYITFVGAIQSLLVVHSIKEDFYNGGNGK